MTGNYIKNFFAGIFVLLAKFIGQLPLHWNQKFGQIIGWIWLHRGKLNQHLTKNWQALLSWHGYGGQNRAN
jgi:lauroyl/myristoyl acyltransferase